jgi:hypothetical protein
MAAIVKGGFWEFNGVPILASVHTTTVLKRKITNALGKKQSQALREVMRTLNGVAPGSAANKQYTRILASDELGGVRPIETEFLVSRATTSGDVTGINSNVLATSSKGYNTNPPPNLDGNPLGTR